MSDESKRIIDEIHAAWRDCSKKRDPVKSYQVRPYYDGLEILQALWVCEECGQYMFEDFERERQHGMESV